MAAEKKSNVRKTLQSLEIKGFIIDELLDTISDEDLTHPELNITSLSKKEEAKLKFFHKKAIAKGVTTYINQLEKAPTEQFKQYLTAYQIFLSKSTFLLASNKPSPISTLLIKKFTDAIQWNKYALKALDRATHN
ncbi:MAG: hypothetical protein WCJ81_02135 [bacterium]